MSQYMDEWRRSMGLRPKRPQFSLTREEEESLAAELARKGMSSLQYIGESIDKPMAAIRGVLAGKPLEALNVIPFSDLLGLTSSEGAFYDQIGVTDDEDTVYGRDLLETYGVLDRNEEGFGGRASDGSWDIPDAVGDVLGFGVDLIGLPVVGQIGTTAKTLTKGGTLLKKAGLLDEAAIAAGRAGKSMTPSSMGTVGQALGRTSDPLEALATMSRSAKRSGEDLSKLYNQRVGYRAAFRAPFGYGGVKNAESLVDPLMSAASRVVPAPLRTSAIAANAALRGAFGGKNANMFSPQAQREAAPHLMQLRNQYERNARDIVSGMADTVHRNQEALGKLGQYRNAAGKDVDDVTTGIYQLYEAPVGPSKTAAKILEQSGPDALADLTRSQSRVRQALDTIPGIQNEMGVASNALEDEFIEYMTRSVMGKPVKGSSGTRTAAAIDAGGTLQRSDYLKNIPGGTATLRRIAQGTTDQNNIKDIIARAKGFGVDSEQAALIAKFMSEADPTILQAGVYTDPINQMLRRLQSAAKGRANAEAVADVIGNQGVLNRSLQGATESRTIADVARQLGAQQDVFLRQAAIRNSIDVDTGNLAKAADLERYGVPDLGELLGDAPIASAQPRTLGEAALDVPAKTMDRFRKQVENRDLDLADLIRDYRRGKMQRLERYAADKGLDLNKHLGRVIGDTTQEFGEKQIGNKLYKDLTNLNPEVAGPNPMQGLLDFNDSITSLFKGSVTAPFPAFHARNRVSGAVREALAGSNSLRGLIGLRGRGLNPADNIASKISRGMPLNPAESKLVADIPDVQAYMREGSSVEDALRRMQYRDMPGRGQGYALDAAQDPVRQAAAQTADEVTDIGLAGGIGGTQKFEGLRAALSKYFPRSWSEANIMNQRGVRGPLGVAGEARSTTTFSPSAAGQHVGEHTENLNRIAPYLQRIFAGTDPTEAARRVLETQIDYSGAALSKFEQEYLTRLIPFYKFSRGNLPYVAKQLATDPGGRTSALVRSPNALHRARDTENQILPAHVAESLAIPLGVNSDGSERFIRNLGLMEEDIFGILSPQDPIGGLLREVGGRMNPLIKAPIELMTNQSLYQQGRPLDQMDPVLGRLASNVMQLATGEEQRPARMPQFLEHGIANLPVSRMLSVLRQMTDPRKLPEFVGGQDQDYGLPLLGNLMSGINVSDISDDAMDKQLRRFIDDSYSSMGGRNMEMTYVPEYERARMTPEQLQEYERLKALKNLLAKRRRDRLR